MLVWTTHIHCHLSLIVCSYISREMYYLLLFTFICPTKQRTDPDLRPGFQQNVYDPSSTECRELSIQSSSHGKISMCTKDQCQQLLQNQPN